MSVKATAQCTLSQTVDVSAVVRYYLLQASTATAPSKPTAKEPSGWTTTEPTYTSASTNSLYTCDRTDLTDGTWSWSDVSLSSSYDAAKSAWNLANTANNTANTTSGYIAYDAGTATLTLGKTGDDGKVTIDNDSMDIVNGTKTLASFGQSSTVIGDTTATNISIDSDSIDFSNGALSVPKYLSIGNQSGTKVSISTDSVDLCLLSGSSNVVVGSNEGPAGTVIRSGEGGMVINASILTQTNDQLYVMRPECKGELRDWVTSITTSGIWTIRKYASGRIELDASEDTRVICCNNAVGALWVAGNYSYQFPITLSKVLWYGVTSASDGVFFVRAFLDSGGVTITPASIYNWYSNTDYLYAHIHVIGMA